MVCKGKCRGLRAKKPAGNMGRYESGQKRCQVCDIWIQYPGLWCPCCRYRLRAMPRSKKYKEMLRDKKQDGG